ncbi:MAG: methyltransferase domain-containing protein [Phycisphaerales bacterium]
MTQASDLGRRRISAEIMDRPDLDFARHDQALRGLARLNAIARSARLIWIPLEASIRRHTAREDSRPFRVLDLATASGDIPIALARMAARRGYRVDIEACDISRRAIHQARRSVVNAGVTGVRFFVRDAMEVDDSAGVYDAVICSLFLHHLDRASAIDLLRRMDHLAGQVAVVCDLRRGAGGFAVTALATRLLSRSPIVHHDGLRSVEAAFTVDEANGLALAASLQAYTLEACWPFRWRLVWTPGGNQ